MKNLFQQLIPMLIPYLVVVVILGIVALLDLRKRFETRGPKWMWAVLICFTGFIGPLAYFIFGKKDE